MRNWLEAGAAIFAILAITFAGFQGLLKLRRDRVGNEIGRESLVYRSQVAKHDPSLF